MAYDKPQLTTVTYGIRCIRPHGVFEHLKRACIATSGRQNWFSFSTHARTHAQAVLLCCHTIARDVIYWGYIYNPPRHPPTNTTNATPTRHEHDTNTTRTRHAHPPQPHAKPDWPETQ